MTIHSSDQEVIPVSFEDVSNATKWVITNMVANKLISLPKLSPTSDPTLVPDPTLVQDPTLVPDPILVPDPTPARYPTPVPDPAQGSVPKNI